MRDRRFFVYSIDIANISPGAIGTGNIQITQDSDFELCQLLATTSLSGANIGVNSSGVATVTNAGNGYVENNFALQVTDLGSGINLTNQPTKQAIITGNAFNSQMQQSPMVFAAGSNVLFSVTSLVNNYTAGQSSSGTLTVSISMVGYKLIN